MRSQPIKAKVLHDRAVERNLNGDRRLSRKADDEALEKLWNEVKIPVAEKRLAERDAGRRRALPFDEVFACIEKAGQGRLVGQKIPKRKRRPKRIPSQ